MSDGHSTSDTLEAIETQPSLPQNPNGMGLGDWFKNGKMKYVRFVLATLSAIPWVGGFLGGLGGMTAEYEQDKNNELFRFWMQEHQQKIDELGKTLQDIFARFEQIGPDIDERIQSEDYLNLVKSAFKVWDEAATEEKRLLVKKLITHAGASPIYSDDLIRLFLNWIEQYHESHFSVIRSIYQNPGISRGEMWDAAHTERPREDSAEADLFRFLIRDLSTGGVVRQARETDMDGRFLTQRRTGTGHRSSGQSRVMESAFEDSKQYVLTELGKQFVHFVLDDVVVRLGSESSSS